MKNGFEWIQHKHSIARFTELLPAFFYVGVVLLDGRKEVKALGPPIFVYNLGVILPIDRLPELKIWSETLVKSIEIIQSILTSFYQEDKTT